MKTHIDTLHRLADLALGHARAFGFTAPEIVIGRGDLTVPGTVAFWIKDETADGHAGILVNDRVGVVSEFDAGQHKPGRLPRGGLGALLLDAAGS